MRLLLYIGGLALVLLLGSWAYQENYRTREVMSDIRSVRATIRDTRAWIETLRTEWAFLNRPDRLQNLVNLTFKEVELLAMEPDQIVSVTLVPIRRTSQAGDLARATIDDGPDSPEGEH